jgi:hypothetical protein
MSSSVDVRKAGSVASGGEPVRPADPTARPGLVGLRHLGDGVEWSFALLRVLDRDLVGLRTRVRVREPGVDASCACASRVCP